MRTRGGATPLRRADVLRRGLGGGAALIASGAALGALAAPAAPVAPDVDLFYFRLLTAAELLKADFQGRALASGKLDAPATRLVRQMQADDRAHSAGLAALLNGEGQTAATPDDIDFSYPRGSFDSRASIAKLGWRLGTLTVGAYLGAIQHVQSPAARLALAQIAANEAQQLGALAPFARRPAIGSAFAAALPIDSVSAALDEYER
jgi:ferritin-like protein